MLYNAFFTSWPCLFAACFEQDVSSKKSLLHPTLYLAGKVHAHFNGQVFWRWIALALWHGLIAFFVPVLGLAGPAEPAGPLGHWVVSTLAFSVIVHTVTAKLFVESEYWHFVSAAAAALSLALYHVVLLVGSTPSLAEIFQPEAAGVAD